MTPLRARAVLPWFAGLWLAASAASVAQTGASEPAPPAEAEAPPAVRVLRTGGLRVETAALLLSGQQGGPVALEARALPLPEKIAGAPDKAKVAVVIEAASRALARAAASEGLPLLPVDVVVYALDGRGALAGSVIETIEIREPETALGGVKGLRFVAALALRPGAYTLNVLVGHAATRTIGLAKLSLDLPAASEIAPPPAYPPGGEGWLVVESLSARGFDLPPHLAVDAIAGVDPARGWLESQAGAGTTPAGLPGPSAEDPEAPGHWRRSEAAALRATYAKILARLGAAGAGVAAEVKALEGIAAFEAPLLSGPKAATRDELTGLEGAVLRRLERSNPETLVPLMALYRTLHGMYQRRNLRQPAMHAAILVGSLAELYARAVPTPEGRRLAAGFLVSLTPNLDRSGLSSMVEAEFKRATEIDPDHPEALLGRAQDHERHGRYEEALAALERLEALAPSDPEVPLRLAINTSRLSGRTKRAREKFLQILAPLREPAENGSRPADPPWPLAVAAQELARLEIAAKDYAAARRAVAWGLAGFPEDEKLMLLSATLSDLPGATEAERAAAKERLARWTPPSSREPTPRARYDLLSRGGIEALWQSLERAARERIPALAAALGPEDKIK